MIKLQKSDAAPVPIKPRWPYQYVHIEDSTYAALLKAQQQLSTKNIQLVLTRGLEKEGSLLKILHLVFRKIGCILFFIIFPRRWNEAKDIFSTNGHDKDGRSIDVSIVVNDRALHFLSRGVFTTSSEIKENYHKNQQIIDTVWRVLESSGFKIHPNKTESLQIHCDYQDTFFST